MIELRSPDGRARALILPEHGARLHQLFVTVQGREEPLLWSPEDPAEYAERPSRGGCFPMAPWPNRIANGRFAWEGQEYEVPLDGKPHAIHGRVYQKAWEVKQAGNDRCRLGCAFDDGWPWTGEVTSDVQISDARLALHLEVLANAAFPAGLGWHPWFRRDALGGAVRVTVAAHERYELVQGIPTGQLVPVVGVHNLNAGPLLSDRRLDDCYRAFGPITLQWRKGALRMESTASDLHVQVYTPPEAFCVEPQTCAPDAFNLAARGVEGSGVMSVAAGGTVGFTTTWWWNL